MTFRTNGYLFGKIAEAVDDRDHPKHGVAQELSAKFRDMEDHFFRHIHPSVDVGLALDQNTESRQDGAEPNIMTIHGCRHVSDLVTNLDKIATHIGEHVESYELDLEEAYILLCSAHVHDAGNIGGRADHAAKCGKIVAEHKDLFSGTERRQQVYDVSRVHGGVDEEFGEDTFRSLASEDYYQRPRVPLLAAILRMGDELSENPERVPKELAAWQTMSGQSELAHRYAETFRHFALQRDELFVTLRVYPAQHNCAATVDDGRVTFYEYLEQRLTKMEREARYCSQYGRPYLSIRRIRVSIKCHQADPPSPPTRSRSLTLELETGYPSELRPLTERCSELRGYATLEEYCTGGRE